MKTIFKLICVILLSVLLIQCGGTSSLSSSEGSDAESGDDSGSGDDSDSGSSGLTPPFDQLMNLEQCDDSNSVFSSSPLDEASFVAILPLGLAEGPNHTLPTGHTYIAMADKSIAQPIYAPVDATIYRVRYATNSNSNTTSYTINFAPCANMSAHFGHVTSLASSISSQIVFDDSECSVTGDVTDCTKEGMEISISAGEVIAYIGGPTEDGSANLDFGLLDSRVTTYELLGTTTQERALYNPHVVCPYDYYSDSGLMSLFDSRLTSGFQVAGDPLCGTIDTDVVSHAQGRWYNQDEALTSELAHIHLGPHFRNPNKGNFSIGSQNDLDGAVYVFTLQSSGVVNRDFADVSSDGNIYCYENLADSVFSSNNVSGYVFLTMPDDSSITLEYVASGSCPVDPNTLVFTNASATFIR